MKHAEYLDVSRPQDVQDSIGPFHDYANLERLRMRDDWTRPRKLRDLRRALGYPVHNSVGIPLRRLR